MFKDKISIHSVGNPELNLQENYSVSTLLSFVDQMIPGFKQYYLKITDEPHENLVSFHIVNYFNSCLLDHDEGFSPFKFLFVKNPPQEGSKKETDIGVVPLSKSKPLSTIIEFEAKRFCSSSNNKEYVNGERGGIERFKRGMHGSHLTIAGMFGYIQESNFLNCVEKINGWISELAANNTDETIDWASPEERLISLEELESVSKWVSRNSRSGNTHLKLFHYLLDLTS
jgi:hypothetical protein